MEPSRLLILTKKKAVYVHPTYCRAEHCSLAYSYQLNRVSVVKMHNQFPKHPADTPVHPVSTPGCDKQEGWRVADSKCYGSDIGAAGRAVTQT